MLTRRRSNQEWNEENGSGGDVTSPSHVYVGMVAEFELLKWPKSTPENFNPVFYEAFHQPAWYLAGCQFMCGTRLAMAVINTCFIKLFLLSEDTLVVEVPGHLANAAR
ncbi:hypothetical protein DXG03_000748 [Asterophora parasitica]|uniref:Uncharacterized protein n=1 Tax=Asterophora parasitica TaxID=117018 RepID=A0A9P7GA85_9AGAR|nr:hypothetical protein DXG03_000748 [Asterophora parasitica]